MKKRVVQILVITLFACGCIMFMLLAYIGQKLETGTLGNEICALTGMSPVKEHAAQMTEILMQQMDDPTLEISEHSRYIMLLRIYQRMTLLKIIAALPLVAGTLLQMRMRAKTQKKQRMGTKQITICGMLLAVMLILGWVEKQVAPGSYGIKLGLSNSVLIFAVCMLDVPTAYILMIYKVLLSSMLFGGFGSSFMIAFSGGILSLTIMALVSRIKGMHPATISAAGGAFHNIGQIAMAIVVSPVNRKLLTTFTLPALILAGMGFGLLTGICAAKVMKHLKHMRF